MPRSSSAPPPSSFSTVLATWVTGTPNSDRTTLTSPISPWATSRLSSTEAGKNRVQTALQQQDRGAFHTATFYLLKVVSCINCSCNKTHKSSKSYSAVDSSFFSGQNLAYLHKEDIIHLSTGQDLPHFLAVHGQGLLTQHVFLGIHKEQASAQMVWVDHSDIHHIYVHMKPRMRGQQWRSDFSSKIPSHVMH